jgi:hypothetical protein
MRLSLSLLPALLLTLPAFAADPKLVRVTLSTGGVGEYEFTAALTGPDHIDIPAALGQVDDVLASLRIDDPAGGGASLRLPGRQPVEEAFRTLPIGMDALASPEALLQALVGAEIRLPGASLTGSIVSVTPMDAKQPDGAVITRHRLTIATEAGIASVVLEDQSEVELASDPFRAQLAAALAAIAGHREQDRQLLQIDLPAAGPRTIRFGYVVAAPVWKASYRVTLPATGPARLQGYAVVENLSGQDWSGVDLVLTSGQPVLFHQALYESVFVTRPDLPVSAGIAGTPQADEGAQPEAPRAAKMEMRRALPAPAIAPAPMAAAPPPVSEPQDTGVSAEQAATQVEFHIAAPVDATAGQSLMVPILDRTIPAKRVALVSPESGLHPFVALQITNEANSALPPGLATLYRDADGARFVGNAALPAMQPGEDRLLSFAGDLSTRVTKSESGDSAIVAVHAARGAVVVTARDRNVTTYHVTTAPGEARSLLIEQPIREGWALTEPAGGSRTPTRWRIGQDIPAGVTQDIAVVTEHPRSQTLQVASLSPALLRDYAGSTGIDPAARAAFSRASALYADADRQHDAVKAITTKIAAITTDQERIRANLASTAQNQALQKRYTAMLQQQEDDLASQRGQLDAAQAAYDKQAAAFKDYLASMAF